MIRPEYFRFYFMGAIFIVMYNVFVGILHAVGDSKHPLYYLIVSTLVNIILDMLFVAVLGMGVGSAAIATGAALFKKVNDKWNFASQREMFARANVKVDSLAGILHL